ncbi:MAG: tetratricopeptide repeat protein [Acidobacteria bacterium]|nr:tetratricopeptide repeat protein [Acidobacteriota bacterium]
MIWVSLSVYLNASAAHVLGRGGAGVDPAQRPKKPSPTAQAQAEQKASETAQQQAIAAFEEGQRAHERGDLQKAIEQYDEALKIIPDFPEALYQSGMAHLALKQLDQAHANLARLVELESETLASAGDATNPQLHSFFARVHSALGDIFTERGDQAKAEQNYRRALELDPTWQRATTSLASLLIERAAFQEAATLLRAAVQAGGAPASIYNLLGYVYEKSTQPDLALEAYNKAIEMEPRHRLTRLRRSHLRAARQDYPGAIEDMAVVYEQDNSVANALELGVLYERAGKPIEAISAYERALKNPAPSVDTKRLRLKIIELLISADRRDEALAQAQHVMNEPPDDADALARLGSLLLPLDPAQAAQAYLRALKLAPQKVDDQVGLSAALLKMKRYQDVVNVSLDALKRAPENYYAHSNLATAYFQLHQFAQALDHFKWIIDHRPETTIAYYFLGICYDKLMDYELALAAYERFLEKADASQHQMEIDNVRFRLPGVRRMIEKNRGQRRR